MSLRYCVLTLKQTNSSLETPNYQERHRGQEREPDRGSLNTGEHKTENLSMKEGEREQKEELMYKYIL